MSDFTYVATWSGFVYVAFVIDVYALWIVGWRASRTASAGFVLDGSRRFMPAGRSTAAWSITLIAAQYVSIKYSERLAEAGIEPSVGSVRFLRQRARRNVIGLFKTEVIHRRGPWRSLDAVDTPRSNGRCSTTADSWSRSATFRQPRRKRTTTRPLRSPGWPRSPQPK